MAKKIDSQAAKGREGILEYLLANMGRVIDGPDELRRASGNQSEWARRLRELRVEHGYQILTHRDRKGLKPGEYLLETAERKAAFVRGVSKETRAFVLDRNGATCQMCGLAAGDPDPFVAGRTVRLVIGHVVDQSKGGTDESDNLKAQCTNCNEGLQNTARLRPDQIHLLSEIRRAPEANQKAVLDWLQRKFRSRNGKK
jgi:hypothetical protein